MTTKLLNVAVSLLRAIPIHVLIIVLLAAPSYLVEGTADAADSKAPATSVNLSDELDFPEVDYSPFDSRQFLQTPNDVRDILVVEGGFFVATGTAIVRYQYFDGKPIATSVDTASNGLPSGNCYSLKRDASGGIWAHCTGGTGYLALNADRWQSFTSKSGLAPGVVKNVVLSGDAKRVWVCSSRGIATTLIDDIAWQIFPAVNLESIFVHPTRDIVWCPHYRGFMISQFVLATSEWRTIPDPEEVDDKLGPSEFTIIHGKLWISRGFAPPLLYDLSKNESRSWPWETHWRRTEKNNDTYWEWFGDIVESTSRKRGPWYATTAGIWRFDSAKEKWEAHVRTDNPDAGRTSLLCGKDGTTLYWSSRGKVAAFDSVNSQWSDLWQAKESVLQEDSLFYEDSSLYVATPAMTLSPDGQNLWLVRFEGVIVGNPITRRVITLDDADHPGLSTTRFIRFDHSHQLALIATSHGILCSDYEGNLKYSLSRPAPPIHHRVSGFEFAPDGSEVWCLMQDKFGHAMTPAVLFPQEGRYERAFDPGTSGQFFGMKVSSDGKTVWLSRRLNEDNGTSVVQRKLGDPTWIPFSVQMPEYCSDPERFVESPNGDEIWMTSTGDGLIRAKLTTGEITQYKQNKLGHDRGIRHETLVGDFVHDLTFTANGKIAVCSAGGGGKGGISVINLESGVPTNYLTDHDLNNQLVASPDNRTVWCVVPNTSLWGFDVQTNSWTHKFSAKQDVPLEHFESLNCSADGAYLWVHGHDGLAVYSVADDRWESFTGDNWSCYQDVFRFTSDGKHVVCGHRPNLALINIDGSDTVVLSPMTGMNNGDLTHLVAIPGTSDFVCFLTHYRRGGLYYVDVDRRSLRKLKEMNDSNVTAMAMGPDGCLWLANSGQILCLDPQSGQERTGLMALKTGEPETTSLHHSGKSDASKIQIAPPSARTGKVSPAPDPLPPRPSAVSLNNKDLGNPSLYLPTIATADSGRVYITWLMVSQNQTAFDGPLLKIPHEVTSGIPRWQNTGVSVYDGQQWLPPQQLRCEASFTWCQDEDLHLLVKASNEELHHLSYRPATQAWTKVKVLNHGGTKFSVQGKSVHLAWSDNQQPRICYRLYNGKEWLEPNWFEAHDNFEGLVLAADSDNLGHIVWREEEKFVVHATVQDEKLNSSRQELSDRAIADQDYAIAVFPDGSLKMAYRADLYDDHPDQHRAHFRTWNGQTWSEATVIPFKNFDSPLFVRHAKKILLSWIDKDLRTRVFSVLESDGVWSYPLPLCSGQNEDLKRDSFTSFHADQQGRVHAAWGTKDETFTTIVTDLGQ